MSNSVVSEISDNNGVVYDIASKQFDGDRTVALTGDVTGSASWNGAGQLSLTTSIAAGAVDTNELADEAVTNAKLEDQAVTLDKIASSSKATSISSSTGTKLTTEGAVVSYVDTIISGQSVYKGSQTVSTINTWTSSDLHNGDKVLCADAGTITLGSITVRAGDMLIFYKSGDTSIWQNVEGDNKQKQEAVDVSGGTTKTLTRLQQNANGDITPTFSDIQTATASQKGVMQVGTGLSVSSGTVSVSYGSAEGTACQGNDSRLSDSRTPKSHTHGNITNAGALQTTDVTIASGDKLVVTDASNSNLVARSATSFDGSTTTKALTPKGTFETFLQTHQDISGKEDKSNKVSAFQTTTDDTHYPSEKLVKDSLDAKLDDSQLVTAWSSTTSDTNIPSEKLVKDALDGKQAAGNYKTTQTAKSDPTSSGTTITAIDTISQNANGEITATKKTIRTATTSQTGVVQLSSSSSSSDESKAATPKGVWAAIDTLDATVTSTDGSNVQVKVTETNGKVSAVNITTDNTEKAFTINYDATNHALVFGKAFGTVS